MSTFLYLTLFIGMGVYWYLLTPIALYQALISLGLGCLYGILTSFLIRFVLISSTLQMVMNAFEGTIFINLIGSKNTLLIHRTLNK